MAVAGGMFFTIYCAEVNAKVSITKHLFLNRRTVPRAVCGRAGEGLRILTDALRDGRGKRSLTSFNTTPWGRITSERSVKKALLWKM